MAAQLLFQLTRLAPDHPETWRGLATHHAKLEEWPAAAAAMARAAALKADDFELWRLLGHAQDQAGDPAASLLSLRTAMGLAAQAPQWLALSVEFDRQGGYEDALAAIEQHLRLDPSSSIGLLQRSRCLKALGQAEAAAADCRSLMTRPAFAARAWFSLVDLKTVPLTGEELARLEKAAVASGALEDRVLLDFALGKALEDAGRPDRALAVFRRANAAAKASHPWDSAGFARRVEAVRAAFTDGPASQARSQGSEVIFLVGLPRSGTTLVEQVLASHSEVEGASELPYLNMVVAEESRRRGQPFPAWAASTSTDDWTRLGARYLALSARWRADKPRATDKLPENWLLAGAALAMLPEARVIDCRRDPVETCWSCFKQLFGPGRVGFTYDFADLAANWKAYDGLCRFFESRYPQRFRAQGYEALVADPETQIRALLDFCGLPFEPQCLHPHTAQRAIRTPSALQVRQPMRKTSTPAAGYGPALDELRRLLD